MLFFVRRHSVSSHFLFERARCCSRSRDVLVLSCPSIFKPFCRFPPVLMASVDDGSHVRISPVLGISSNYGSPNGSGPDFDGMNGSPLNRFIVQRCPIYICYHSLLYSQTYTLKSGPFVKLWVLSLPVLSRSSMLFVPRWRCVQQWNNTSARVQKMSALSLHMYARLKQKQRPSLATWFGNLLEFTWT